MSTKRSHSQNAVIWTKIPYESAKECVVLISETFYDKVNDKESNKAIGYSSDKSLNLNIRNLSVKESGSSSLHKIEKRNCEDNFQRVFLGIRLDVTKMGRTQKVSSHTSLRTEVHN